MIFCKSRERIILDRIDKLEDKMIKLILWKPMHVVTKNMHEADCLERAINRMYKLIKK